MENHAAELKLLLDLESTDTTNCFGKSTSWTKQVRRFWPSGRLTAKSIVRLREVMIRDGDAGNSNGHRLDGRDRFSPCLKGKLPPT